jgi:hypothetical protein
MAMLHILLNKFTDNCTLTVELKPPLCSSQKDEVIQTQHYISIVVPEQACVASRTSTVERRFRSLDADSLAAPGPGFGSTGSTPRITKIRSAQLKSPGIKMCESPQRRVITVVDEVRSEFPTVQF